MASMAERMNKVEQRLEKVESGLNEVRTEVGELRTEVGGLRTEVGGLRTEVNSLRVLGEANANDIRTVAEVQVHHGQKLDEIARSLEPLAELREFIRIVAPEHERRIKALEQHTGLKPKPVAGR